MLTFLSSSASVIIIAQFFGLFPISGTRSKRPDGISFTWKSIRALFSSCFIFFAFLFSFLVLYLQSQAGPLNPSNLVGFLFFWSCACICLLFFCFAMNFKLFMERWTRVEQKMSKLNFTEAVSASRWSLRKRIGVCAGVSLVGALVEHLMALASNTQQVLYESRVCNWTKSNFIEDFVSKHLYFTFSFVEYNPIIAVIAEYLNFSFTFYWNFVDIFIMVVSIGIAFNFELINSRIEFFRERAIPDETWWEVRSAYNEVSELLKFVSGSMDKLILVACLNDAYFIMVQLLNIST